MSPPKKAPRPPAALVAALEVYVCDTSKANAKRAKAFQMLIKTYCSLREDDAQNLAPAQFRFFSGILVNTLCRTKTSGPTKRVKELPVCLAAETSLTDLPWLTAGLALVQTFGSEERDHLLTNFSTNFESSKPGRLSYASSAALGQRILSEVHLPDFQNGKWVETDRLLLPSALTAAFTEHGPRAFMPTILAELETERSQKDFVGRWSPTGSDDYTRSYRAVVKRLQLEATKAIKGLDPRLGEGDVLERLTLFGEQLELRDLPVHLQFLAENLERFKVSLKKASEHEFAIVEEPEAQEDLATPVAIVQNAFKLAEKRHFTRVNPCNSKFLIIFSQGRKFARLHKADGTCPWAYTLVRDCIEVDEPKAAQYNARCKICFPNGDSDTSNSEEDIS